MVRKASESHLTADKHLIALVKNKLEQSNGVATDVCEQQLLPWKLNIADTGFGPKMGTREILVPHD